MPYPQYFTRTYVNPSGNIEASGYYMAYETQEMANRYPYWTDIREDSTSVGQQFLSPFGMIAHDLSKKLTESLNEKFIGLAPVDEIDVLTRMKIPSTISFLNNPKITCWTAPSGVTPSGYPFPMPEADTSNVIQITEKEDLEEFYYYTLPTRLKAYDGMTYSNSLADSLGVSFLVRPSGIEEPFSKYVDTWKRDHDITWTHASGVESEFLKQDAETMETYETFGTGGTGWPKGFTFYQNKLYWIGGPLSTWQIPNNLSPYCVGEYRMDDNAADRWVKNERGEDGYAVRDTIITHRAGKLGGALSFNGTSDYVDSTETYESTCQSSFTVSLWCKFEDLITPPPAGDRYYLFGLIRTWISDIFQYLYLYIQTDGLLSGGIGWGDGSLASRWSCAISTEAGVLTQLEGTWVHVAMVMDNDAKFGYLYVNGELSATGAFNAAVPPMDLATYTNSRNLYIGAYNYNNVPIWFFDGEIDDFLFFNKALNASEILDLYREPGYFLNISNPHPAPLATCLDTLATFDIADLTALPSGNDPHGLAPSGIDIDEEGHIWIISEDRNTLYALDTMHDYFLTDKENRYVYFLEDYSDPGVFIKTA